MKTTVKFLLRASLRAQGYGILQLHVTRHRRTSTLSTTYVLSFDEWDEKQQKVNPLKNFPYGRKKELIAIEKKVKNDQQLIAKIVERFEMKGDYTSQDVICSFREQQQGKLFCEYINHIVKIKKKNEKFGTAHSYEYAARSFLKFLKGKDIGIKKINGALIKEYERYLLAENKSKNTVSCYMRSLRAAYNQAILEKVFVEKEPKYNPFSNVFTGNEVSNQHEYYKKYYDY